ncbi:YbaK/EbsC family protein [Lentilactobacillus senioris]|uniref:YbaK/EbsC family protein n=1 Tax=Lentilactobacillus senioris TaxID=931534 RepID=UPI002093146A|nr:YbaK/EbsC family protein [Lentilactobacillus senioris]
MSLEAVKQYFAEQGLAGRIVVHDQASDTVEHAATVIGCSPGQIAKTMAFQQKEGVVLVVMAGDYKINNQPTRPNFTKKPLWCRLLKWLP